MDLLLRIFSGISHGWENACTLVLDGLDGRVCTNKSIISTCIIQDMKTPLNDNSILSHLGRSRSLA